MSAESPQEAFARGVTAGEIAEQLRRHEDHLDRINGSTERTARALEQQAMALQRIADQMDADRATVITTAKALKDRAESSWAPVARIGFVLMVAAAVVGVIIASR